nr:T9SS type A sorting domain-containing protein [Bacteroidota bacterium]
MTRIQIYIAMLCMMAIGANAQTTINGTAGTLNGPGGTIKDIKAAEQSPANIRYKGETKIVDQFFAKEIDDDDEQSIERLMNEMQFTKDNSMRKSAPFYQIDENKQVSAPPTFEPGQKVTSQSPARTGLGNQQGGLDPSDAQIAAGPSHIVLLANDDARIINKQSGAVISDVTLAAFFGMTGFVFDPRIMYDPYGQRFVALALNGATQTCGAGNVNSFFRLLISYNSDPTQGWYWYDIDVDASNTAWMDFAMIGFNKDWICVAGNILCGNAPGIYVLNKAQVYAAASANFYYWNSLWLAAPAFTYDNAIDRLYLVKTGNPNLNNTGYIDSWYINSVPQLVQASSYGTSPWQAFATDSLKCPKQLGGGTTFSAVNIFGASMLSNCVYRNGLLWCTHPIFLPATGNTNRASTQWWSVNPAAPSISQVGRIDDGTGATSEYYPSLAVNSSSDVVLTYSIFNAAYYQSAAYNSRNSADALGTLPNGVFYYSGQSYDSDGRGGDYSQCAVDPLDQTSMWVVNQIPNGNWETRYSLLPGYYGCYTDASFGNNVWSGYTKNEASSSITSAEMIQSPSVVEYDAGGYVSLTPGFVANQGSQFTAYINGCGGARTMSDKNNIEAAAPQQKQKVESKEIGVFPNPASNKCYITLGDMMDEKVNIKLYDMNLRLVKDLATDLNIVTKQTILEYDIAAMQPGAYFVKIESSQVNSLQKLIIVK